ncbi:MAG: NAD-dependent epimerase/dehydratase family protein [Chthoniobacterales bacterium]
MRLFLTGATGFVGLNLLLEALRSGRYSEIVAAVRDPAKLRSQLAHEGVSDLSRLAIVGWNDSAPPDIDHAVHCAGVLFARDRDAYFRVNVDDTMRLLAALPASAKIVVLSSQAAAGPTPAGREIRAASDPDAPITWYGESKLAMEKKLRDIRPDALILRPPMILGPRDRATLPLFRMAAGPIRIKPGFAPKSYSWIAVHDLVRGIFAGLGQSAAIPLAACAPDPITDLELIETAALVLDRRGKTLALPHLFIRGVSAFVDAIPALRESTPSLTRDRARDIFADRWVADGSDFRARFASGPFATLRDTLAETAEWYARAGLLDMPARIT